MNVRRMLRRLIWGAVLVGLGGGAAVIRGQGEAYRLEDVLAGKRLFRARDWTATGLTCVHCHADFNEKKEPDGYLRPGHSLFNSAHRTEWHTWDGRVLRSLEEAISTCMQRWMTERVAGETRGKPPAAHHLRQFMAYLGSDDVSPEKKSKPVEPQLADALPSDRALTVGDPMLGAVIFRRSCALCHEADGSGPAPSLVRNGYNRYQIAKQVRGIENPGLEGLVMPPFAKDRLSDRELINVAAFVFQM